MAVSFPLSEKKSRSVIDENIEMLGQKEIVFIEGEQIELSRKAYRRAAGARNACIAYHGSKCSICEFDFELVYGEIGRGYIHVHHIKEISAFEGEHCVDPIRDLVPVCPNCHAMLHHRSRPSCVDLKSKMKTAKPTQKVIW
jgi:5-methylcytosine-specific restriction enzyme A